MKFKVIGENKKLNYTLALAIEEYAQEGEVSLCLKESEEAIKQLNLPISQVSFTDTERLTSNLLQSDVVVYAPSYNHSNVQLVNEFELILKAVISAEVKHFMFIGSIYDKENSQYELSAFNAYVSRRLMTANVKSTVIKTPIIVDDILEQIPVNISHKKIYYPACLAEIQYIHSSELALACALVANNVEEWYQVINLSSNDYINPDILQAEIKAVYKKNVEVELMEVPNEQIASLVKALKFENYDIKNDFERIVGREPLSLNALIAREKPEKQGLFSRFGKKNK